MHDASQESLLAWTFSALGVRYTLLLPLAGLVCFLLVLLLVIRGKGPWVSTALLLIVPLPLLLGIFAAIEGLIASYAVIANSPTIPKPSEWAAGYAAALVAPIVGMLVMGPAYATACLGSFLRSMLEHGHPPK